MLHYIPTLLLSLVMGAGLALLGGCASQPQKVQDSVVTDSSSETSVDEESNAFGTDEDLSASVESDETSESMDSVDSSKEVAQWVVYYVKEDQTKFFSSKDSSAKEKGFLKKGDKLLCKEDGDWVRTINQTYVQTDDLSTKAVPYARTSPVWQSKLAH